MGRVFHKRMKCPARPLFLTFAALIIAALISACLRVDVDTHVVYSPMSLEDARSSRIESTRIPAALMPTRAATDLGRPDDVISRWK